MFVILSFACSCDSIGVYHLTFDPAFEEDVVARLERLPNDTEDHVKKQLVDYHHHLAGIAACFTRVTKHVNADQPQVRQLQSVFIVVESSFVLRSIVSDHQNHCHFCHHEIHHHIIAV